MKRTWIPGIATLLVLVALWRMPYGYYMLLRLGLCIGCLYYIFQVRPQLASGHRFTLGGLAFLYNPIIPVHLGSKSLWMLVNLATVVYFWVLEIRGAPGRPKDQTQAREARLSEAHQTKRASDAETSGDEILGPIDDDAAVLAKVLAQFSFAALCEQPTTTVAGRLTIQGERAIPADWRARLIRDDQGWQSGFLPVKEGAFVCQVSLREHQTNTFHLELFDATGQAVPVEPDTFCITHGRVDDRWYPFVEVELENGRILEVKRMLVTLTFENSLMTSREEASYTIRTDPEELVFKGFQPREPTVIVDDGKDVDPLPNYKILAYMESRTPVSSQDPEMDYSYLTACWFTDNVVMPPEEIVKGLFRKISWEEFARDGNRGEDAW